MNLEGLNPEQIQAIEHIDGPLLILAGAGSGKTKTLTSRLAYLISEVGIPPNLILCLTFTNKASKEMKERAFKLIGGDQANPPLLCTFHKFGLLFLKEYIGLLGRSSSFILLDSDDVKKVIKPLQSSFAPSVILGYISFFKNQALSPQEALNQAKFEENKKIAEIYWNYQEYLESKNLLDFDDLLYLPYLILRENPHLREQMGQRYAYIMVDEYQDTNILQYKLLKLLTSTHQNLCVVGDEDQSIYGWRGADIRNILEFEKDFEEAKVIKLEKNYRSTPQILEFANRLISHNTQRLGKTLYSMQEDGESVRVENFRDEREEIQSIAREIKALLLQGVKHEEIAILYRLNALSRGVEEGLNKARIPYQLIGAMPFYERSEIKDALSYLRLMVNDGDDFSLLRVLNKPKRGIGETSKENLRKLSRGKSIYEIFSSNAGAIPSVGAIPLAGAIPPKIFKALEEFFALIAELRASFEKSLESFMRCFEKIPLLEDYPEVEREDRKANLLELFGLLREFFEENPDLKMEDFLNDLSLNATFEKDAGAKISCMSVHLSKGLEFDYVFVIGCEDGFFPLQADSLEEERRLGYVAFTRAKKQLSLSYVSSRFYRGKRQALPPSRFLREASKGSQAIHEGEIKKGTLVKHKIFGIGRVQEIIGVRNEAKARVNFGGNERMLLLSFLEIVE